MQQTTKNNPGLIWLPYIPITLNTIISGGNNPCKTISSRYSRKFIFKQNRRKQKIKNIFKTENPSN